MKKREACCITCDCWKVVRPDGECIACYQHRRRHGHDRPIALIIAWGRRDEERRAMSAAGGA